MRSPSSDVKVYFEYFRTTRSRDVERPPRRSRQSDPSPGQPTLQWGSIAADRQQALQSVWVFLPPFFAPNLGISIPT